MAEDFRAHDVVGELLGDIYRSGDLWDDRHEAILDQWRAIRGEAAMDKWAWWIGEVGGESYDDERATRDDAIALGRREYAQQGRFMIVEARMWNDAVKEGEDVSTFAQMRNQATIEISAND